MPGPIVETSCGLLRGGWEAGVAVFRGVRYAAPPVGARRFAAPEAPKPWAGVREACAVAPAAPQVPMRIAALVPGLAVGDRDEDCLHLNVFTPAADGGRRPVLVWLHGGAYVAGAGSQRVFDGERLARRGDAVVVTPNYRLGALGFLYLEELGGERIGAASNAALLDQLAALRWVRDNAAAFGGDPGNVTVFGQSSGGHSVATLLAVPEARGLFQRAIAQSGSIQPLHSRASATELASRFLAELGVGDVAELPRAPLARIEAAQAAVLARERTAPEVCPFRPVVDGRLLPTSPLAAVERGSARDVPLLVGTTRDEWNFYALSDYTPRELDRAALAERLAADMPEIDPERALAVYRETRQAGAPDALLSHLFAMESDRFFRAPAIRLAEAQLRHRPDDTYLYLFTWESPGFGGRLGACHAIDLPFVFGCLDQPGMEMLAGTGEGPRRLAERTMDAWSAFARGGDPSHPGLGAWPGYDTRRRATMLLGRSCGVVDDPFAERRRVWGGVWDRIATQAG